RRCPRAAARSRARTVDRGRPRLRLGGRAPLGRLAPRRSCGRPLAARPREGEPHRGAAGRGRPRRRHGRRGFGGVALRTRTRRAVATLAPPGRGRPRAARRFGLREAPMTREGKAERAEKAPRIEGVVVRQDARGCRVLLADGTDRWCPVRGRVHLSGTETTKT